MSWKCIIRGKGLQAFLILPSSKRHHALFRGVKHNQLLLTKQGNLWPCYFASKSGRIYCCSVRAEEEEFVRFSFLSFEIAMMLKDKLGNCSNIPPPTSLQDLKMIENSWANNETKRREIFQEGFSLWWTSSNCYDSSTPSIHKFERVQEFEFEWQFLTPYALGREWRH